MLNAKYDNWLNDGTGINYDGLLTYIAWNDNRHKLFDMKRIKINYLLPDIDKQDEERIISKFPGFIGRFFVLTQLSGWYGCVSKFSILINDDNVINFNVDKNIPDFVLDIKKDIPQGYVMDDRAVKEYNNLVNQYSRIESSCDVDKQLKDLPNILGRKGYFIPAIRNEILRIYEDLKIINKKENEDKQNEINNQKIKEEIEEKRINDLVLKAIQINK